MIIHLLVIQIITFVVLLLVLRQLFYKQLGAALARLRALHESNLARESELNKHLEEARSEREETLKKARDEADKIIKDAILESEKRAADMSADTRERMARIQEKAKADLERKTKDLLAEHRHQAVELAVRMIKLAFSPKGQRALQDQLLDEIIAEVGMLDPKVFSIPSNMVDVVVAYPVSDPRQKELERVLTQKTGMRLMVSFREDPAIIAGLVINIGSLTLDGSLRNKLEKAAVFLKSNG